MCSKCSSCWYDGNFTVKTKPKKFQGSKGRKLVELYRLGKKLTKKQKLRAKWYLKRINKQWVRIKQKTYTIFFFINHCPFYHS